MWRYTVTSGSSARLFFVSVLQVLADDHDMSVCGTGEMPALLNLAGEGVWHDVALADSADAGSGVVTIQFHDCVHTK